MVRVLLAALLVSPLVLAGCLGAPQDVEGATLPIVLGLLPSTEPLWHNPQTTPHPAFGYPTLTHPATGADVPAWWKPIAPRAMPASIQGLELVAETGGDVPAGGGMSVFGSLAVVPGLGAGTSVLDISDPSSPKLLATIDDEEIGHRNVDFIAYPDGRLVATFASSIGRIDVWDVTDPTMPVQLLQADDGPAGIEPTAGVHKVNVVPGTPIVYNANSNGGGCVGPQVHWLLCFTVQQPRTADMGQGITEIYDLTDPENPVHVQDWANGFGCHHIYFWIDPAQEKYRALCAGIEYTQIWDIADPLNPTVVVNVPFQHGNPKVPSGTLGLYGFSHFAILDDSGTILMVGDESGGGAFPPGCDVGVQAGPRHASGPLGNVWFYDVSDEKNPVLKGWFSPSPPLAENPPTDGPFDAVFYSCTAHHGRLVPDPEGRDLLAMAFYRAGVYLIDFSDPTNPVEVDHYQGKGNVWEVQYYHGHLFTGDISRGMDVLGFV